ncbi:MAG: hypothetical protein K5850_08540, partial [Bacteroidales bacterium]|nr:hypothetical protein [Bacteroidales bacterium]
PEWNIHLIDSSKPFKVHSSAEDDDLHWVSGQGYYRTPVTLCDPLPPVEVIPIQGWHHKEKVLSVLGFRFGNIAYITDMNLIEDAELEKLHNLDAVTVNCVKRGPHFSHFSLAEALEFFEKVGAKESYITHISHLLPAYEDFEKELPPHVHLAYDGLTIG